MKSADIFKKIKRFLLSIKKQTPLAVCVDLPVRLPFLKLFIK